MKTKKIAIQGGNSSFHHQAAGYYYKNKDVDLVHCNTFDDLYIALESNQVESAATLYGLDVLCEKIQNHETNITRFLVISKKKKSIEGFRKVSAVFTIDCIDQAIIGSK